MTKTFLPDRTIVTLISFRNDDWTILTDDTIVNEKQNTTHNNNSFLVLFTKKNFEIF